MDTFSIDKAKMRGRLDERDMRLGSYGGWY